MQIKSAFIIFILLKFRNEDDYDDDDDYNDDDDGYGGGAVCGNGGSGDDDDYDADHDDYDEEEEEVEDNYREKHLLTVKPVSFTELIEDNKKKLYRLIKRNAFAKTKRCFSDFLLYIHSQLAIYDAPCKILLNY